MTIKAITYKEYEDMDNESPNRKYRKLVGGIIVLESEAEEIFAGDRETFSVAYKLLMKPISISNGHLNYSRKGTKGTLTEIKDTEKLEKIVTICGLS